MSWLVRPTRASPILREKCETVIFHQAKVAGFTVITVNESSSLVIRPINI
ncbi:hypothetical protein M8845_14210 [Gelidibacter japonicus]|nr:hypothetical protein [Gelidibacter japonicus]